MSHRDQTRFGQTCGHPSPERIAEQIVDVPQFREETVEAVTLVPRELVQQWTAAQMVVVLTAEETGEEIVDFTESWKKFFDMYTDTNACLAAVQELRTQLVARGMIL